MLQLTVFSGILLYFGQSLFVPLSFALLVSVVLYPICLWLEKKGFSRMLAIIFGLILLTLIVASVLLLLVRQFVLFTHEWPKIYDKIQLLIIDISHYLENVFNITVSQQSDFIERNMDNAIGHLVNILQGAIYSSAINVVLLLIIPVYVFLILYYRHILVKALYKFFPEHEQDRIKATLYDSIKTYYNFIKGMAVVYLVVGILNSIGLAIIGVPHALVFGFIASILTFIPYIGIIIGSLLPIAVSWITYNSIFYPIGVVVVFSIVQYLEAYVIFPLAVSSRLQINTLAILIVIIAGGILWGAAGMILFIPFAGIFKLIADKTESLKPISIALSSERHKRRSNPPHKKIFRKSRP